MPFLTTDDLKDQLRTKTAQQDAELQRHVNVADRIVAYLIGPSTVVTATDERTSAHRSGKIVLRQRPIVAVVAIETLAGSTAIDASSVDIVDANAGVIQRRNGRFYGDYLFTYTYGRSVVEESQTQAGVVIAQHLWRLVNGRGGAPRPGEDDELVTLAGIGYAIPRRALEILGMDPTPYTLPGIA